MTRPLYELARMTVPSPKRQDIDLGKLARLQTERHELRTLLASLNRQRGEEHEDLQHAVGFFPASAAASRHWRPGDDTAVFLQMTGDQARQFQTEVFAARQIAERKAGLQALAARIDHLHARLGPLNRLVAACETFANSPEV